MTRFSLVAVLVAAVFGAGVPAASAARAGNILCVTQQDCACVTVYVGGTPIEIC